MTVFNLGSINVDRFYRVPRLPSPGETLPAAGLSIGLGGKGANQSVAVARGGAKVFQIGMVGPDNGWVVDRLHALGVDTTFIGTSDSPTGHAIINVDDSGENAIVTLAGANFDLSTEHVERALESAVAGDVFMFQNEVSSKAEAARRAREKGMTVVYSAAPFREDIVAELLPLVDLLVLNEIEARQLGRALGVPEDRLPVPNVLVTRGARGAAWTDTKAGTVLGIPAFEVEPVDTTAAGDCFIGHLVASLDKGYRREEAMRRAAAASAIKVTRHGAAEAIPTEAEIDTFLAGIETHGKDQRPSG
ncbi:MAG: ribokinase [Alphaproteobacteria bacterium]|nr:MAG: ribokinase [Alphaproteobacteria bacterium]